MNYDRFVSKISAGRFQHGLRYLPRLYAVAPPGTIFMGGGMPNISTFPFSKIQVEVTHPTDMTITLEGKHLHDALQYQQTPGYIPLLEKLKALQTRVHGLRSDFWDSNELLVTAGSLDAFCKSIEMCMEVGDPIVIQEPSYPGVLAAIRPYNPRFIAAVQDEFGMCPKQLREALAREGTPQQVRGRNTGVPKVLYVNPVGCNPTGATISNERKREIYKIACDYNLLILEDDPYYFLRFDEEAPTSFLSLDTEGRVLRFDSLSKVLSSGLRLGYVTGPKALIDRIELHMQVSVMHASGLPQVLVNSLLTEWKDAALDSHFKRVSSFYKKQRDFMLAAADKYLKGLADWTVPLAGMFLWLKVRGVRDVRRMVTEGGLSHGVILVPGHAFLLDEDKPCPFIRASFSTASEEDMDKGFSRLANLIKAESARQDG